MKQWHRYSIELRWLAACGFSAGLTLLPGVSEVVQAAPKVDFSRDVRPILSNTCFKCHGPDEATRAAGLRLDTPEGSTAKLESGHQAITPGKLDESALIARILSSDPDVKMPPEASGKHLTPQQIETIKQWVAEGGEYRKHWSFMAPVRLEPPLAAEGQDPVRTAIDRFVLQRLKDEGLQPSPAADKVTLIRRVTLDLTGLPPTPAEVDAYLADSDPNAYEKVVDRLLASPRYGEHMARFWLDVARYGDTHGLHFDNVRSIWLYRDWVVSAFNSNKSFDRFTVEQLAGDLLSEPTLDQKIATGFSRCNISSNEGGSINEELLVRYAVDRTETMGSVFLGLTVGCAVCHDHKFDPVTQKDFYQLFAFFRSTQDQAMDGNIPAPPPIMRAPSAEHLAQMASLDLQVVTKQAQIKEMLAKLEYTEPAPVEGAPAPGEPKEFVWIDDEIPAGASVSGSGAWQFVSAPEPVFTGAKASFREATDLSQHFFESAPVPLIIGEGDKLFAHVYLDPANPPKEIMLQWNNGSWEHRAVWGDDLIPWGAAGSASRYAMGPLPELGKWVRLEIEAAKVGLQPGTLVHGWAFTQHGGRVFWDTAGIVTKTPQNGQAFESLSAWVGYEKGNSKSIASDVVKKALQADPATLNDEQKQAIKEHFLEYVYPHSKGQFDPLHKEIEDLRAQKKKVDESIPSTLVMAEMKDQRDTFLLIRGAYDKHGEKVTPNTPASLPPMAENAPKTRLGLAQWLVEPNHPLTARVAVNRFWQQIFGRGIVKTSEDFGAQGNWPTHPELLDWLATEFIGSGWDVKHMLKLMVMSQTYRQSSAIPPGMAERDPENALLARGARFRLDAESVRDAALFSSGLLVEKLGGPPVRPYQPSGVWEAVGFRGSDTTNFTRDTGEALYRRTLYTFWKRTAPPPALQTFDAPSRETCTSRRGRTNTPLQALVLMNDEQYVEAARRLAQRVMTEGGKLPSERAAYGFRWVTGRAPRADELDVIVRVFADQFAHYRENVEGAKELLKVGESPRDEKLDAAEHAAWTMTANVLLNLDEAITKE